MEEFKSWIKKVEKSHIECIVLFAVKQQTLQMEDHQSYSLIRKEKRTVI